MVYVRTIFRAIELVKSLDVLVLARTIFGAIYHDRTVYELLVGVRWSLLNVYVIAIQMLDKIGLAVILISIDIPVGNLYLI